MPRKLTACHFGHARHRFGGPDLGSDNCLTSAGGRNSIFSVVVYILYIYIYILKSNFFATHVSKVSIPFKYVNVTCYSETREIFPSY